MIRQGSTTLRYTSPQQDMFHAAATLANRGEYGSLILDGMGRIRSCGEAVERMFGASQVRLIGVRVSEFIADLFLGGSSPSYSARYLVHLCADSEWRKFEATDADGFEFAVELNLSRMMTDGQEVFILNLRLPEEST